MSILVSIVINCYNGEKYLLEALHSVMNQTYTNWELIFWDNQSIDRSSSIVKNFKDERIKYYLSPKHTNLSLARFNAIEKTFGDWIAFLDCDDLWHHQKLEKQINQIQNQEIGLVFGKTELIINNNSYNKLKKFKKNNEKNYFKKSTSFNLFNRLVKKNYIYFSSVIIKKSFYLKTKKININLEVAEDYDLLLKIAKISKAACVEETISYYRIHETNLSFKLEKYIAYETLIILKEYLPNKIVQKAINYQLVVFFINFLICRKFKLIYDLLKIEKNIFSYFSGLIEVLRNKNDN